MRLNIGLFNESFPPMIDGVSMSVFNYARCITKNHHPSRCTVVTPRYPRVEDDYSFEVYRHSSVDIFKSVGYRVGNMLSLKTLRDLYRHRFDIIHVHSPFASMLIADELCRFDRTIPIVFTYHTKFDMDIAKRVKSKTVQKVALQLLRRNIKRADEVWVVSRGAVESLRKVGYKGDYRVMPNGTDFARGKADPAAVEEIRRKYDIGDERVLLYVGRTEWYKNIRITIDALAALPELNFKMIFVGDGFDRPAIEQYAARVGIGPRCVFVGAVNDREQVRAFFSVADLFLFPSTYDTSGLVVKEAAACSLPSVLVDGSCAAEDVVDGFSGYLCEENAESMAQTVRRALSDEQRLKKIGEQACESVYLSWDESVARAYKRYGEIVSARRNADRSKKNKKLWKGKNKDE